MDDLRSEIRAAFEQEQAAHPPLGGLRITLTAAAASQPRPARNFRWIAVAVAALLVIAVVVGLVSTRLGPRANVPGANPGTLKDYGPPPTGVPLMYLIDPHNTRWLQAYDWQGKPRGTIKFAKPVDVGYQSIFAAPDGSGFRYQPEGGPIEFLDRLGRPIAPGLLPAPDYAWNWADDNRHICVVRFATPSGEWSLSTMLPGEADHLVGIIPSASKISDSTPFLGSCSFRNDRAIVMRTAASTPAPPDPPSELWVFRISDGKVLSDYKYSSNGSVEAVIASDDGAFIAENSSRSAAQPRAGAPSTLIRRVSDRSVVATLDPSVKVLAFSGDDSRVLAAIGTPWKSLRPPGQILSWSIIDLQSGLVTWHQDEVLMTAATQPDGPAFAISTDVSGSNGTHGPLGAFEIIHADGSVTKIPGSFTPA